MSRISSEVGPGLDQLRLRIHEAGLEPELWPGVVGSIVRLVGGGSGNMMLLESTSTAPTLYIPHNVDPEAGRQFQAYWHEHDLWMQAGTKYPARSVIIGQEMVPDRTLFASAFYNDFVRHQHVGRVLTNLFEKNSTMLAHVSAHRAAQDDEFAEPECKVMRTLAPHLATAVAVHVRLSGLEDRIRATEAALDRLPVGVCLIGETSKITHRNLMAREILAANDGIAERSGSLCAAAARESRDLAARIAEAVATGLGRAASTGVILPISRPSMRRPYSVLVAPLTHARDPTNGLIGQTRPCAIVLLTDLEREPQYPTESLIGRYRLTAAEARLACDIVAGSSLQDAADKFGVAIGTARNQLKQIFAKTDVNRQAELVRLLTTDLAAQAAQLVHS